MIEQMLIHTINNIKGLIEILVNLKSNFYQQLTKRTTYDLKQLRIYTLARYEY